MLLLLLLLMLPVVDAKDEKGGKEKYNAINRGRLAAARKFHTRLEWPSAVA